MTLDNVVGSRYVLSDAHGEFDKLMEMAKLIKFSIDDHLYVIGDVVDRGEKPIEIIEWVMEHENVTLLRGNHEAMMLDVLCRPDGYERDVALDMWVSNGGRTTIEGFNKRSREQRRRIINFLNETPLYKVIGNVILVHSGVYLTGTDLFDDIESFMSFQREDDLLWSRKNFYGYEGIPGYRIFFGHTPTASLRESLGESVEVPLSVWYDPTYGDKVGLDCGAVFGHLGGRLGCVCLDSGEEFYV